jgi:nitrite reductase/ring-hydroxylating ferredoxin subunit
MFPCPLNQILIIRERRGTNIIFTSGIGNIMALLLPTLIGYIVVTHRCHAWAFIPQSFKSSSSSGRFVHTSFRHIPRLRKASIEATISLPATNSANPTDSVPYDWRDDHWYAVTFSSYLPNPSRSAEVMPVSVYGQLLVLWKSEDDGVVYCADDVCPHRLAALSEGPLREGKLECYYHSWQSNRSKDGECKSIPQLEKGAEIPKQACLKMHPLWWTPTLQLAIRARHGHLFFVNMTTQ